MADYEDLAYGIRKIAAASIKHFVLDAVKELRPFPKMKIGIPCKDNSKLYRKLKEHEGIVIDRKEEGSLDNIWYILLKPSGLFWSLGECSSCFRGGRRPLPIVETEMSASDEDYLIYQKRIFDAIEEAKRKAIS